MLGGLPAGGFPAFGQRRVTSSHQPRHAGRRPSDLTDLSARTPHRPSSRGGPPTTLVLASRGEEHCDVRDPRMDRREGACSAPVLQPRGSRRDLGRGLASDGRGVAGVIAVTGFGEFEGVKHNPTEVLVRKLMSSHEAHQLQGIDGTDTTPASAGVRSWAGVAAEALPSLIPGLLPQSVNQPTLSPGWALGRCDVLTVAGQGSLPDLLRILDEPRAGTARSSKNSAYKTFSTESDVSSIRKQRCVVPVATSFGSMQQVRAEHLGFPWRDFQQHDLLVTSTADPVMRVTEVFENRSIGMQDLARERRVPGLDEPGLMVTERGSLMELKAGTSSASSSNGTSCISLTDNVVGGLPQKVIWLHLGVSSHSRQFQIESRAVNEASFRCPDQLGWKPWKEEICPVDGSIDHFLETDLPVDWLVSNLRHEGFAVSRSEDAGRFVCNYVYYHSLRRSRLVSGQSPFARGDKGPVGNSSAAARHSSLFVHVPEFKAIAISEQVKFLQRLLELICSCC